MPRIRTREIDWGLVEKDWYDSTVTTPQICMRHKIKNIKRLKEEAIARGWGKRPNISGEVRARGSKGRKDVKQHDWAAIEIDYRAGQLSPNELAAKYNISVKQIYNRSSKFGWLKDLDKAAVLETKRRLIKQRVDEHLSKAMTVEEVIKDAEEFAVKVTAEANVKLIDEHRGLLSKIRKLAEALASEALAVTTIPLDKREALERAITETGVVNAAEVASAMKMGNRLAALRDISTSLGRIIPLERESNNLSTSGEDSFDAWLKKQGLEAK